MTTKTLDIFALGDTSVKNAVRTMAVTHPDDKSVELKNGKTPITVDYVGSESDDFQESNHENRKILNERAIAGEPYDPKLEDQNVFRSIAYCTKGWQGVPKSWMTGVATDTDDLPFSREIAMVVYARLPWFRQQVNVNIWKREPFAKAS